MKLYVCIKIVCFKLNIISSNFSFVLIVRLSSNQAMSKSCCQHGPGYSSPLDAMQNGPREKLLYVITVQPNIDEPHGNYLSTIDVDPKSSTYSQIIHRTYTNHPEDELHHSGWNACSSCYEIKEGQTNIPKRDKLILPCLNSSAVYVIDVSKDPLKPVIHKRIDGSELEKHNVTAPHTSHCLANGNIMISTMGDRDGKAKGDFILLNSNFDVIGSWVKGKPAYCGYDFWYQPYFNTMAASEWGAPNLFYRGFKLTDLDDPKEYGRRINFYKWKEQQLVQSIDLGDEGIAPLEIRFLHDPKQDQGYVGCALFSKIFWYHRDSKTNEYVAEKVIDIPAKGVEGWMLSQLNGLTSDILISLDDRFLYFSNWLHGDVRQYDISNPGHPKLTGQVFLGGILANFPNIKVTEDNELSARPQAVTIKDKTLQGGPQMLQLSLDGKRLYVSSSLFSPWDKQFYPNMITAGGFIVQLDIDLEKGGMKINPNFLIDFGKEPYGPTLPHEMRYPGGDVTSDIWLAND